MLALHLVVAVTLTLGPGVTTGQTPPQSPSAAKPPYQRLLQGEEAKQAADLEKRIVEKMTVDQYAEAITVAEQLLALRARIQGADHHEAVSHRWHLERLRKLAALPAEERRAWPQTVTKYRQAEQLHGQGRYREALPLFRESADTAARLLGEAHPDTATGYNNVAACLQAQGKAGEALTLHHKALEITRQSLGEAHPHTARSYHNVAACLQAQGKATEALPLYQQALEIRRQALGEAHPDTAGSYNSVAACLQAQGRAAEALPLLQKALEINRQSLGETHPATATSYSNVAYCLQDQGKAAEALPLYQKALAIRRQALGEVHPHTAISYNNIAYCLNAQGKSAEALPLYHKTLAIRRQSLGEAHPQTANSYHNVASCLHDQGKAAEALPLYQKALAIYRQALGEAHPDTATGYNNLAGCLLDLGKAAEALPLYQKALGIRRQALGEAHPHTARSYNNVAACLQDLGNAAEALPLSQKALAITRQTLGEAHPDTATSYNNLALILKAQGNAAEALPLSQKALQIYRQTVGEAHPDTATSYTNVASCLQGQGKTAEALAACGAAVYAYELARLRIAARGLDRANALTSPRAAQAAALARAGRPAEAWQTLEADCARGLLDEDSVRRQLPPKARIRLQEVNARLDALQTRQAALLADARPLDQKQPELAALRGQRQQAEAEVDALAAAFSQDEVWPLAKVQSHLPARTALLAWVDVRDHSGQVQEHWAALLRSEGPPVWVRPTGRGEQGAWTQEDNDLPHQVRAALARADSAPAERLRQLSDQRLRPLEDQLKDIQHLIVLSSPALLGIPVETLSDRFTVSYVASGTQLVRLLQSRPQRSASPSLLALGDPAFASRAALKPAPLPPHGVLLTQVQPGSNADRSGLKAGDVLLRYGTTHLDKPDDLKTQGGTDPVPVEVWRDGQRSTRTVSAGPLGVLIARESAPVVLKQKQEADALIALSRGGPHAPLPGTRREVEAIARLFPDATVLLGPDASKSRLEQLRTADKLSGYRYLHLATHGEVNRAIAFSSALILADEPGKDDWQTQLTAAEMRDQWQLNAELVTLSACETGQGRHGSGEGLLGFSQALFLAGARSVVLSLWKVDDDATALLMQRFYQNLLGKRDGLKAQLSKAEALREAKAWLRELTREQIDAEVKLLPVERGVRAKAVAAPTAAKPFAHPHYWAAFVLIGDPT